jgi:hypothetical protein
MINKTLEDIILISLKKLTDEEIEADEMRDEFENDLNENELKVLNSLVNSSFGNGHDFGFTDEYDECGFTKHQMAGYIGQLSTKGYIVCVDHSLDPGTECNAVQFNFTLKAEAILDDVFVDYNHYND